MYYHEENPMHEYINTNSTWYKKSRHRGQHSTVKNLFSESNESLFTYYTATMGFDFPELFEYIKPLDFIHTNDYDWQINFWLGSAGVTAHPHYDSADNFFVQIDGQKKFTLFPPESTGWYLFPRLHPNTPQSQVDFDNPDLEEYPLFKNLKGGMEGIVGPGDVLYLPPYWWHRVHTLANSISVNSWWSCWEAETIDALLKLPKPLLKTNPKVQLYLLKHYIGMVSSSILNTNQNGVNDFITNLLLERYSHLFGSPKEEWINMDKEARIDYCGDSEFMKENMEKSLEQGVNQFVELFLTLPKNIQPTVLSHWIEEVAYEGVSADKVYQFLSTCFSNNQI